MCEVVSFKLKTTETLCLLLNTSDKILHNYLVVYVKTYLVGKKSKKW